jgi:F-type H+-transporting ATPase subunit b
MAHIIAPIVNFLLVVALFYKLAGKKVSAFFAGRSEQVRGEMAEAEKMATESGVQLSKWKSSWEGREESVTQQISEAKAAIGRMKEKQIATAQHEAARIKKEAQMAASTEALRAKETLSRELITESVGRAKSYLEDHLDEKDKHKLVTDYVELVQNG